MSDQRPQETIERALAIAAGIAAVDGCIVIADESNTANLRWANNTLTTNGVTNGRRLTVIASVSGSAGTAAGVVSRSAVQTADLDDLVRAAVAAARENTPAQDAGPLVEPSTRSAIRGTTHRLRLQPPSSNASSETSAPSWQTPTPRAAACSGSPSTSSTPPTSAVRRVCGSGTHNRPAGSKSMRNRPTCRGRPGPAQRPATSPTSTSTAIALHSPSASNGRPARSSCPRHGTKRYCHRPRSPT